MLISMLQVHRGDGILAIAEYLRSGAAKPDVTSETLRSIGDFDDAETLTARWRVLRDSLMDKSPMVRDGAILGFANLNDPKAIQVLAQAKMNEPLNELRKLIDKVLEQLNNIK
jgi:HEAT repeat protein